MTFKATYLGSNGWLIDFETIKVLVDPWLSGNLTFPPGDWFFKGELNKKVEAPTDIDLILLTQGLADHTHPDSLKSLNRLIPIIASSTASKIVRDIGFINVTELRPRENKIENLLIVEATAGASVPNIENGYIITYKNDSIYIEPHGFLDEEISPRIIDTLITPTINVGLPLAGNFINGKSILPKLISHFNPKTILSSTTGGDAIFTGLLPQIMIVDGDEKETLKQLDPSITFINPTPFKSYKISGRNS